MKQIIKKKKNITIGPAMQKVLLLLGTGLALALTHRPDTYFRIVKGAAKEWQKINRRSLFRAIRQLYRSKLIHYQENKDGTCSLVLQEAGQRKILQYNLEKMEIKKPARWDKLWRLVIFDIPESNKQGRDEFARKLKQLGFYSLQKSVFIHPYECRDEVDFVVEVFDLRPHVRFLYVQETDVDLHLKEHFELS